MARVKTPSPAISTSDMTSASGSSGIPVIERISATAIVASAAVPAATVIGTMKRFQWNQVATAVTSAMPPISSTATASQETGRASGRERGGAEGKVYVGRI